MHQFSLKKVNRSVKTPVFHNKGKKIGEWWDYNLDFFTFNLWFCYIYLQFEMCIIFP